MDSIDTRSLCRNIVKYIVLGLVISVVLVLLNKNKLTVLDIITVALVAGAVYAILDTFAPNLSYPAQLGAGFGIGAGLVGFPQ
jgi:uncharacterized membrane protein